ncbi:MAG: nucleolar complex-associated protein 3 [Amphiamblys sp. WSBS2006]|nr:MAG: nucleolar complex-associated protein 3 [Amphiamblys sp. WSBS2006]
MSETEKYETLKEAVGKDPDGEVTLSILRNMCRAARKSNYAITEQMVGLLRCVKLQRETENKTLRLHDFVRRKSVSKRELKIHKKERIKRTEGMFLYEKKDVGRRRKINSEILECVFEVYLNTLRFAGGVCAFADGVVSGVFKGMAWFGDKIGGEYVEEIVEETKRLLEAEERKLGAIATLHGILCVQRLVSVTNQRRAGDVKWLYDVLYAAISDVFQKRTVETEFVIKKTFGVLFLSQKELPGPRVASFVHRLLRCCPAASSETGEFILSLVAELMDRHPETGRLFENCDNGFCFLAGCKNPDEANPFRTSIRPVLREIEAAHPQAGTAVRAILEKNPK